MRVSWLLLALVACARNPAALSEGGSPEDVRRRLVAEELAQGRVTPIVTDLRAASAADREMVRHLIAAAQGIERLYALQNGSYGLDERLPPRDEASAELFRRNQGPWCEAPATRDDPQCAAIPDAPPRSAGVYPWEVQQQPDFCDTLARDLPKGMEPFMAVVDIEGTLVAVPYTHRWPDEMDAVAASLRAAAAAADPAEEALKAYLLAAADAFTTNDWFAADVAWAAMNQRNSRWFLRVGPDEVYWDPCGAHAGFHLTLARVNQDGLKWQALLEPHKQAIEASIAERAGPPYAARTVGFELPEFIEIVLNAGNARYPTGSTVGQSLPNWGPVAEAGGRTVAMTNMRTDPESLASLARAQATVWCPESYARWPKAPDAQLFSTVMHEVAHNIGPSHEYAVDGQVDTERFGGPLASMLEELKAQSAAMALPRWLVARDVDVGDPLVGNMGDLGWALGKIAGGMVDGQGRSLAYGQLAAIQVGWMLDHGALSWQADLPSASGAETGCLQVHVEALPGAVDALFDEVLRIKSQGDKPAAEALRARYVDEGTTFASLRGVIAQRFAREPASSFTYDILLD